MSISNGFRLSSLEFTGGHGKQKGKSGICNLSAFFTDSEQAELGMLAVWFQRLIRDSIGDFNRGY